VIEQLRLQYLKLKESFGVQFPSQFRAPSKHSGSRAGSVEQNGVGADVGRKASGILRYGSDDGDAESFGVRLCFFKLLFIAVNGSNLTTVVHQLSHEGGFPSRSGTQVEYLAARGRIEQQAGKRLSRVLNGEATIDHCGFKRAEIF